MTLEKYTKSSKNKNRLQQHKKGLKKMLKKMRDKSQLLLRKMTEFFSSCRTPDLRSLPSFLDLLSYSQKRIAQLKQLVLKKYTNTKWLRSLVWLVLTALTNQVVTLLVKSKKGAFNTTTVFKSKLLNLIKSLFRSLRIILKGFKKRRKVFSTHVFQLSLSLKKNVFNSQYRSLYLSAAATLTIFIVSWCVYQNIFVNLPSPMDLSEKEQILTTRILDRNGNLLYRIYEDENRTLVSLNQISQHMINATIAIEDQEFYNHQGFSIRGIARAIWANLSKDKLEGGSTITQQLVKNRLLDSKKTIQRKIRELILSILVEGTYSKEEILWMYLNQVPYGGSTYGVEEAAWRYFDKPAKELSLGESSLLAGLPVAPTIYSPFGPNPELSVRRQEEVLRRMVEDGYISLEEAYLAKQEDLSFRKDTIDIQAPHFVMYIKKLLVEKFGEDALNRGGLEVRTSLDINLQQQAQQIVAEEVEKVSYLNVNNGAALVTNPQTGEVLAMAGSVNYFDFEHDGQVNVTLRPRQPGSSIKPLVYAMAFEQGRHPTSTIEDTPITYQKPGSRPYSPRNYDGRFRGTVTLRQALASSYNVPAVKLLAGIGVNNMVEKARDMGISTWTDSSRFGLSLSLGAGEVLMTDLATLYGTFANFGYTIELDPFIEIRDYEGSLLYRNQCFDDSAACRQLETVDPFVAYQITDILSDNQARSSTFGSHSLLQIPNQQVAVKTGTTNSMRDNWTIGYTTDRLVSVWVGNNDNSPMSFVASGVTGASPIWNQVIRLLLNEEVPHRFELPKQLVKIKICAPTATLPCRECPLIIEEVFVKGEEPAQACNWQYFKKEEAKEQPTIGERERIL